MSTTETFALKVGNKPTIDKDPDAVKDYTVDFGDWLTPMADTIASVDVDVDGVTEAFTATHDGTTVTVWISGGTAATTCSARVRITTVGSGTHPRVEDQTIYFKIKER